MVQELNSHAAKHFAVDRCGGWSAVMPLFVILSFELKQVLSFSVWDVYCIVVHHIHVNSYTFESVYCPICQAVCRLCLRIFSLRFCQFYKLFFSLEQVPHFETPERCYFFRCSGIRNRVKTVEILQPQWRSSWLSNFVQGKIFVA